jgi:HlyD family type I secretion membrane fusion protein
MYGVPELEQWHRGVSADLRSPMLFGGAALVLCLGGFALWAGVAPLDGAIVVSGSFVASGQNKQIQHLEGGIVRDVLVEEGQLVEVAHPLVRLDETAAVAKLRRLVIRKHRLVIMKARLEAEIRDGSDIELPTVTEQDVDQQEIAAIHSRQLMELRARREKVVAEEHVLRKEIAGLRESIVGYNAQLKSTNERLSLFAEELRDKSTLLKRQLVRKTEILSLQRAEAGLAGEVAEQQARIADARERIARSEQQIVQLHTSTIQKILEEMRNTEADLDDVQEQVRAQRDVVDRLEVKAPVRGIVVKLNYHTRGGVIAPGAVLLELLPSNDKLVIEARVNPAEVTHVMEGSDALVRLTALNQRLVPMIEGKVIYLSADTVSGPDMRARTEQVPRAGSFIVRVALDEGDLIEKANMFRPTPGMPADVFIKTGERTFLEYLMKPVRNSFARAFREH